VRIRITVKPRGLTRDGIETKEIVRIIGVSVLQKFRLTEVLLYYYYFVHGYLQIVNRAYRSRGYTGTDWAGRVASWRGHQLNTLGEFCEWKIESRQKVLLSFWLDGHTHLCIPSGHRWTLCNCICAVWPRSPRWSCPDWTPRGSDTSAGSGAWLSVISWRWHPSARRSLLKYY